MDSVAILDKEERRLLFEQTAAEAGFAPWVAEKDFWVCWTLKYLFALPEDYPALLFKGGTSLSKVFGLIRRFSEDIDLSMNRQDLGFAEDPDPEDLSAKQRKDMIAALDQAVASLVADTLLPDVRARFSDALGADGWSLEALDGGPNLRFTYPAATTTPAAGYASQSVLIEIGGRSDHTPADDHSISPYAHQHFPEYFTDPTCTVRVMAAERTFWEKATILHALHHGGAKKAQRMGLARHYYDLSQLASSSIGEEAVARVEILDQVRTHKMIYFYAAWARYDEAVPGSLQLVPSEDATSLLQRDFDQMKAAGYFYGDDPPPFSHIVGELAELEAAINQS